MSHVVSVKCYITDRAAAAAVADPLGFVFQPDAKSFHTFNGYEACEGKFARKDRKAGAYEIGLRPVGDGKYEAVYDPWGTGGKAIEDLAGKGLSRFKDALAEDVTARHLAREGYRVVRTVEADGTITLTGIA